MPALESPAAEAAEVAQRKVHECIDKNESFLLEAGAGAGKTYSLIEALKYLIKTRGALLARRQQQIACITYTNVATDEIRSRTDGHPAVRCSTIHAFCWSLLKNFQPFLRPLIRGLNEKWEEKLNEVGGDIGQRKIGYDEFGHRKIGDDTLSLHHDDVLALFRHCLENTKFRALLRARYPVIFIDEYQDTNRETIDAIKLHLMTGPDQTLVGFFGDDWQQIYENTCGRVEHPTLIRIDKHSNFRSAVAIVKFLNAIRPELPQQVADPDNVGSVIVFHTNPWKGQRRVGNHWADDLPADVANRAFEMALERLKVKGWDEAGSVTKLLMLTNNRIADQNKFREVADCFEYNEAYIKKQDPYIKFFADTVEPACIAFRAKRYASLLTLLGGRASRIRSHADKLKLGAEMADITACRESDSIGAVIEMMKSTEFLKLPDAVVAKEKDLQDAEASGDTERLSKLQSLATLKSLAYRQIISLTEFINDQTPFSTKHGVKGAEFDNVLVVCGRGWNKYNFGQLLESLGTVGSIPSAKRESFERNRNLFYVACSRPKKRLAVLFTQLLSGTALASLAKLCGSKSIEPLPL